jgi:hypothetical protein
MKGCRLPSQGNCKPLSNRVFDISRVRERQGAGAVGWRTRLLSTSSPLSKRLIRCDARKLSTASAMYRETGNPDREAAARTSSANTGLKCTTQERFIGFAPLTASSIPARSCSRAIVAYFFRRSRLVRWRSTDMFYKRYACVRLDGNGM